MATMRAWMSRTKTPQRAAPRSCTAARGNLPNRRPRSWTRLPAASRDIAGREGPWVRGVRRVQPGVLLAGLNPVSTDAVAAAVMGYDPRAARGTAPFRTCENTLLLAEQHGVGSADLRRIDVRGVPIAGAMYRYEA